jgi:hypothetical protein
MKIKALSPKLGIGSSMIRPCCGANNGLWRLFMML